VKALTRILTGFWSLLVGLSITMGHLLRTLFRRKKVTEQYPHEEPTLTPAYRSAIKLIRFDETKSHDCVGCKACERICPSFCISVDGGRVDGIRKKRATHFEMDFALCSLCGLCLDVCPTDTLEYSRLYDEAGYTRDWKHDLLAEFNDFEATFVVEQGEREAAEAEEKARLLAEKKRAAAAALAAKAAREAEAPPQAADATEGGGAASPAEPDAKAAAREARIAAARAAKAAKAATATDDGAASPAEPDAKAAAREARIAAARAAKAAKAAKAATATDGGAGSPAEPDVKAAAREAGVAAEVAKAPDLDATGADPRTEEGP